MTILIAAFLAVQTVAAPPSTFCIQQRCQPVNEIPGTVAPSDTVRDFVWISSDLKQIATGTIQPGANVLSLPAASQHHKLAPRLSDGSTRATLDFELRCQDLTWKWTVTRVPVPGVDLRHPGSGCTLLLKSNGYRSVERQLRDVEVGNVFLQKMPIVSGTVIDAVTAIPLRDARVYLPNGDSLAVTDRKGNFRAPVADVWPQFIRVAMAGYARRTVLLPKAVADTELSVRLSKGGSLTIRLVPPLGQEDVVWEVRRLLAGPPGDELAHSGRLVLIGLMKGARTEIDLTVVLRRHLKVIGSTLRTRPAKEKAQIIAALLARFGAALEAGRLRPPIYKVVPMSNVAEAHRMMAASEHFGKIVLRIA